MNPYLLPSLESGPKVIGRLLGMLPESRHDDRPDPDRFSVREVIAHLADWEPILLDRMRTAIEQPDAPVEGMDEGQRALDQNYAATDVWQQLALLVERRKETAEFLRSLAPEEMQRAFVHRERGRMTVEDQANMLLGHDLYHIEQISALVGQKTAGTW
jgi:hypothetical protein